MSEHSESIAINSAINVPYLSADRSELAPLYSNPQENKGLRTIIIFFSLFSIFIAIILSIQLQYGDHQVVPHGSVVTDSPDCSSAGAFIIKSGGNAVDAAIASTFCMGVVHPHLTGLGSGGLMIIYDQRQRRIRDCLDFRVVKSRSSSIGVPGLIAGLFQAHLSHGILSWKEVISPSILIARSGFQVPDNLFSVKKNITDSSSFLYSWFAQIQQNGTVKNVGLADTLEAIANYGPNVFYKGNLTEQLVLAGNISEFDLNNYNVLRGPSSGLCTEHLYNGYKVILPSHGSGGPFVAKILKYLNFSHVSNTPIAEVGEALIKGNNLEETWPLHYGSVVVTTDLTDMYVSVVSSLGRVLGSKLMLPAGFLLNNGVELGSLTSGNRVVSLAVPFIAVDSKYVCGRRLISGAADARDALQLLFRLLSSTSSEYHNSTDIDLVIESPRVRFTSSSSGHQVWIEKHPRSASSLKPIPSEIDFEVLQKDGFEFKEAELPYPSLNIIEKTSDSIVAHADSRGEGAFVTF